MSTKIRTDDGALGKSIKASRKKVKETDLMLCETSAQMTVNRRQFERLAGLPQGFADHFYNEQGAPFADVSLLFIKRELQASGTFHRGDEQHTATLPIKKATVTDMRFKLEPNGAVFIAKYKWKAAGDEIEHAEKLLGQWVDVDMTFTDPVGKQERLELGGGSSGATVVSITGGASTQPQLPDRLAALGYDVPAESDFWTQASPTDLSKLLDYVTACEKGEACDMPDALARYLDGDDEADAGAELEETT